MAWQFILLNATLSTKGPPGLLFGLLLKYFYQIIKKIPISRKNRNYAENLAW